MQLTKEKIVVGNTELIKTVGLVEVQVEVLDGSLEAPLLFYTDNEGYLSRERPVGTHRSQTPAILRPGSPHAAIPRWRRPRRGEGWVLPDGE